MTKEDLYQKFIPKDRDLKAIANDISTLSTHILFLLDGVTHENVRIRYGCLNTLVILSEKKPDILYPYFEKFMTYFESDKNVVKLGAIKIVCNLSKVDTQNKIEHNYKRLFSFINDPEMTPAANLVKGSKTIIKCKPHLTDAIINDLLSIQNISYKTEECKNILIGHVIDTLNNVFSIVSNKDKLINFVNNQTDNPRTFTSNKAVAFLKKHS